MKKLLKVAGAIAAIGAGVAGGLFIYSKIKSKKNAIDDDFEDDFDDDFDDDDDLSYVDITPSKDTAED